MSEQIIIAPGDETLVLSEQGARGPAGPTGPQGLSGAPGGVAVITQASHGFSVNEAVRFDGAAYVRSQADTPEHSEVFGIVSEVMSADVFKVTCYGAYSSTLPAGTYFLSASAAGTLTLIEPVSVGQVSKPVLNADGSTAFVINMRGALVQAPTVVRDCFMPVFGRPRHRRGLLPSLDVGRNAIYTVPSGRAAIVQGSGPLIYWGAGSSCTYFVELGLADGSWVRSFTNQSISQSQTTTFTAQYLPPILIEGESIAINASTAASVRALLSIFEFDLHPAIKTVRATSVEAGQNILYECPAGKMVAPVYQTPNPIGALYVMSYAYGGSTQIYRHLIPSGAIYDNSTRLSMSAASYSSGSSSVWNLPFMQAGDVLALECSSANSTINHFASFFELDAP